MKRLTIFAILVIHAAAMSAQTYNFFAEDHKIYWQKIYETDMDIDICSLLINTGKFENIRDVDGVISAKMLPCEVELNGRSRGMVPMYLLSSNLTSFIRIQKKEGRYRVTVDHFVFIRNVDTSLGSVGETTSLETYALKRDGTFKPGFFNSESAVILDEMLSILFSEQDNLDKDW